MKVATVIGAGGWGTAVALLLHETGHEVRIWGHDPVNLERMGRERENAKYLKDVALPDDLILTTDHEAAVKSAKLIVSGVPTRHLREVMEPFRGLLPRDVPIVSLTKGIEVETLKRPSQVLREIFAGHAVGILSGPSHAEEVARRIPSSVVIAASGRERARQLQRRFTTERFRVYANVDPVGVELAGALKNVIAIAAGVCDGLGFGDNTKSALVTRGLVEMVRLGSKLGARKQTFAGLAGMGDLITTAFSPHGRNRHVGQRLGEGQPLDRILRETEKVAEGVYTTKAVMTLARRHRVDMPITLEVHDVLFEGKDAAAALQSLMTRSSKAESW
ncbi:MAG: glycerol-3-phosphate dehydrogenase [Planctomycetes bacterium]|nr:glycerol-3-phosphate dehydrogenase [Planctomycetota bacterium]